MAEDHDPLKQSVGGQEWQVDDGHHVNDVNKEAGVEEEQPTAEQESSLGQHLHSVEQQKQKADVHYVNEEVEVEEELKTVEQDEQADADIGVIGVEEEEGQLVAEQDGQEDFDIEGEEVQIQIQGAVQSDDGWGCSESIGHVQPVVHEPDAMQRYLEGLGP